MILPRDYVTPAQRLGRPPVKRRLKPFNGNVYDERHFRFMRQSHGSQWIDPSRGSVGMRLVILGYLLIILIALLASGWKW